MDFYPVGQPIRLSTTVKDTTGALADPGALTLAWKLRGGTPTVKNWPSPAEITRDSVGAFHFDVPAFAVAGHYEYSWVSTGAAAGVDADIFDVFDPATYPRLVSFADAKEFLGVTGTAKDAILDRIVGWASARIIREVQAVTATITERVTVAAGGFVLPITPVQAITAITAVTPYSPAIAVANAYVTNSLGGTVELYSTAAWGVYDVTYTVGYSEVPPGVHGACESLIRHWWNQSQAHGSATYGDAGFVPDFADLPNVVRNMLRSVPRVSGVA
jgi:hypothetical protein